VKERYFVAPAFELFRRLLESDVVKSKRVRLFIKSYCPWCHKAERWLKDHAIRYQAIDVISDETAFAEMIRLSGQELAPVIEVDGKILADFGPEQLAEFWSRLENEHADTAAR
jgi:glutaredoxin